MFGRGDYVMYSSLILLPFFAVIILNLPLRAFMRKAALWVSLFILLMQICFIVYPAACSFSNSLDIFGMFLKFNFVVDNLSRVLLFCIGVVTLCSILVEKYIIDDEERLFNFINISLLLLAGMNGIVMLRDIFSLYVFIEIVAVGSFILIGFNKDIHAFEAAFKYIMLSVISTVMMLSAIALLLILAGGTSFSVLSAALKSSPDTLLVSFVIGIFLCAAFIKAGLMPFHGWLPDTYSEAPAAVSVLLAGIVTKTVGVYVLIRVVNSVFGFDDPLKYILLVVGAVSAVFGALAALGQSDFKRMLAYSSISQVGYIIMGLGCATELGLAGAVFHLFNHSIFKSLLFVNSAAVEFQTGTRDMNKLSGLAEKMPITGTTSVLALLSTAGIPPLSGFWSKLIIVIALWTAGFYLFAMIAILASVLTLAYLLSMQRRVFFGKLGEGLREVKEAGPEIVIPALLLALILVGVGLFFPFIINAFVFPVGNILGG